MFFLKKPSLVYPLHHCVINMIKAANKFACEDTCFSHDKELLPVGGQWSPNLASSAKLLFIVY